MTLEFDSDELAMFVSVLSGPLIVLFVKTCVPVSVATVLSILIVLAVDPSNVVPEFSCRPVPAVKAAVVEAVTVTDPPRDTDDPLIVMLEFVRLALEMFDSVFVDPLIEVPANVVIVPPSATEVEPMVIDEFVRLLLPMLLSVFVDPLMLLLVNVSAPAMVASVPVVGNVTLVEAV